MVNNNISTLLKIICPLVLAALQLGWLARPTKLWARNIRKHFVCRFFHWDHFTLCFPPGFKLCFSVFRQTAGDSYATDSDKVHLDELSRCLQRRTLSFVQLQNVLDVTWLQVPVQNGTFCKSVCMKSPTSSQIKMNGLSRKLRNISIYMTSNTRIICN